MPRTEPSGGFTTSPSNRVVTPVRVAALVALALVALGLVLLRVVPAGPVSVPRGASAGDLHLEDCTYATEDGDYAADCGSLVVAEDGSDPGSRLIALPVVRVRALSDRPAEPIFFLTGGPGGTNMRFAAASRFADARDVVLVGYRGVDGSVRLDCPEVASALAGSADFLSATSFEAYARGFDECAGRLTDEGVDVTEYGLVQQVDDMEVAREALGYEQVDLMSESAGTRTAMIYAWRHPASIHRSVMLGVNPPGNYLWDPVASDEQIARFAELCAADPSCSRRTDDLSASMQRATAEMPDRWLGLPIKEGTVQMVSFFSLMQSTAQAGVTFDALLSATEGDPSGLWLQSMIGDVLFPTLFVWGQYAAAGSVDFAASRDYFADPGPRPYLNPASAGTAFSWGGGRLADAWPAAKEVEKYARARTSDVETLLIGGELDTSTPPRVASRELMPFLPRGQEVVLPGFGHTSSLFDDQPAATARLVNTFLRTGEVDTSLYRPQGVDFTPSLRGTTLAKVAVGTVTGVALAAVLLLGWMARRVRSRGGIGPWAGAVVRTVGPVLLGPGGWCLAVLALLVTRTSFPLDSRVLAGLATGIPVGLGVFLAWAHRGRSARTTSVAFAAALGGALVGAWLGASAADGLLVILTATAGAGVGANLALLALDMASDRLRAGGPAPGVVAPPGRRPVHVSRG